MSHFYERMLNKTIDIYNEIGKIDQLFNEEFLFYNYATFISFTDYLDTAFRRMPISYNNLSCKSVFTGLKEEPFQPQDLFINYCEFASTLLSQFLELKCTHPRDFELVKNQITSIFKVIDCDLEKFSLARKTIESKLGNVTVIVPNDTLLEEALRNVSEKDIQENLILYRTSKLEGNIKEKEKIIKLLSNYVEGITKNSDLKGKNSRLFSDVNFLLNNFEIRHNNTDVNTTKFYNATINDREEWLDLIYSEILFVICSVKENQNHLRIEELKKNI